jgi:beta-mannosidase
MPSPSDLKIPEQHNWGPRDYYKGDFYKHCSARFISETGYHGCPAVSSLRRFIPERELLPVGGSDSWRAHSTDFLLADARDRDRNELMASQVRVMFGEAPGDLAEFALLSQISQAEAKKFFIENTRIQKWRRTGILWWNLIDGWPQISDAVVDYYHRKKLAYHFIRRVSQPICLIMGESEGWRHRLVLCNDSSRDAQIAYSVASGGETLCQGTALSKANENLELPPLPSVPGEQKLYLLRWREEGRAGAGRERANAGRERANHYLAGCVPFDRARMRGWLSEIEALPEPFSADECVR